MIRTPAVVKPMVAGMLPVGFSVRVYGEPRGTPRLKGRVVWPRGTRWVNGWPLLPPARPGLKPPFIQYYTPDAADDWKAAVKRAVAIFLPASPLLGPVRLAIDLLLPRPGRLCRRKDNPGELRAWVKPDRDNGEKAILDSLTDAGLWKDDAQVCAGEVRKLYHAVGDVPGARLVLETLDDTEPADGMASWGKTPGWLF